MTGFWARLFGFDRGARAPSSHPETDRIDWSQMSQVLGGDDTPRQRAEPRDIDPSEWSEWRPSQYNRDADWAIIATAHVKGTQYRRSDACKLVVRAVEADADDPPPSMTIVREPTNPHDANALAVLADVGTAMAMIGYVPADIAAEIAADFPTDMPLRADLTRISVARDKFAIWIDVKRPSKRSAWWKREMEGR